MNNKSKIPSIKTPVISTGAVKRNVLREIPSQTTSKVSQPSSSSVKTVKSVLKPVSLTVSRKSISKRKKDINTSSKATVIKPTITRVNRQISNTTSTITTTRTAVKRPAPAEPASSTSASAPKFSKFDYKGRFNYLEEKHKDLVKTHKESKSRLEELENANKTLEELTSTQKAELEELAKYKVRNQEFINQIKEAHEKNEVLKQQYDEAKSYGKTLQEKLTLEESSHSILKNNFANLTTQNDKLQESYDRLHMQQTNLQENHDLLKQSHSELNEKFVLLQEKCHLAESQVESLKEELKLAKGTIEEYKTSLQEHEELRRKLHNDVQDLKGTIRVFCRVRPVQPDEEDKMPCNFNYLDDSTLELKKSRESSVNGRGQKGETRLEFNFDRVFPEESTQAEVFEDLAQLIQSTLDGYNVCVFAYGQTGSGKTFTMMGNEKNLGMIPRSIDLLFKRINELKKCGWQHEVQVSFLEIYNEAIKDLLNPNSDLPHEIKHNEGKGSTVTNLRIESVETATQVKKLMIIANQNRATATTDFNLHSSRSHSVTKISVRGTFENKEFLGSLNLVDLAGSESAKTSERMQETKSINKSLSALGTVMLSLHNKDTHIPYRNSKLTFLLQSSLGGNSKTLMFVNIAPSEDCYTESVNSLRFASKVKEVKTGSKRNKYLNKTHS